MKVIAPDLFRDIWQHGSSLTHVSVMLRRAGHPDMTPAKCLAMSWALRRMGVGLKKIGRGGELLDDQRDENGSGILSRGGAE